jgi:hypothetical protein
METSFVFQVVLLGCSVRWPRSHFACHVEICTCVQVLVLLLLLLLQGGDVCYKFGSCTWCGIARNGPRAGGGERVRLIKWADIVMQVYAVVIAADLHVIIYSL